MRRIDLKRVNVARSNTIRDINRQIILNYVRERGPISRAEIAQETALQRSTVSLIVEELKEGGLIEELSGESTGGRPPILLSLRTADAVAIGVDLGTRQTIVAASDLAGRVLEQEEFPTDPDARKTIALIVDCARRLICKNKGTIEGIGVSLPGLVDQETGTAVFIPHFKWRDLEVAREIREAVGLAVTADNDANAAALAELWFGRPEIREVRDFIMVLVEEGVGTGIVFDGQVYRGQNGAAGEFGHMTIGQDAPVACAAGSRGCWEAFASERAALARYAKLKRGSGDKAKINFRRLVDLAFDDEKDAQSALKETAYYLGLGIANLVQGLSPEAVIVGGPIVRAWPLIVNEIKSSVQESICRGLPPAHIIASTLGAEPTMMGALSLVLTAKFTPVSLA
ncbi:MAG TPA: ROK family transcriptional regulator [Pyrinomonadaceae bacterium]|jgi:predicted NBD/HSP70 family sugar kinase|nr:ROK family transcriptional regulator [Pyrinomonadaceae bacterium]